MAIDHTTYQGWPHAWRLSNGTATVVVVPAVARIMHYGFEGGSNALWSNPALSGATPTSSTDWANFGGNKVWIWPQVAWPERTGSAWPPAMDLPGVIGHQVEVLDELTLGLVSPAIPGFGARLRREIRLAPRGTLLTMRNVVEKLDTDAGFPMAAWTISQLPAEGAVLGRILPDSRLHEGYRLHDDVPWRVERIGDDILHMERPGDRPAKLGFDGDALAWSHGDQLFIERRVDDARLDEILAGDSAQVYGHIDGDTSLPAGPSYVELELTSPLRTLRAGESVTLVTSMELQRVGPGERSIEALASRLRRS